MDDIYAYIEEMLSNTEEKFVFIYKDLSIPVYGTMPDFGDDEPENYIVYSLYNIPAHYADDTSLALEYTLTIDIFTQSIISGLERAIRKRAEEYGFQYQGSGKLEFENNYPQKIRKNHEYKISIEEK